MILPIYSYGHPILRQKTDEIDANYPDLKALIDNMWETMYNANGVRSCSTSDWSCSTTVYYRC